MVFNYGNKILEKFIIFMLKSNIAIILFFFAGGTLGPLVHNQETRADNCAVSSQRGLRNNESVPPQTHSWCWAWLLMKDEKRDFFKSYVLTFVNLASRCMTRSRLWECHFGKRGTVNVRHSSGNYDTGEFGRDSVWLVDAYWQSICRTGC